MAPTRNGFAEMLFGAGNANPNNAFPPAPQPTQGGGLLGLLSGMFNPPSMPQLMQSPPRAQRRGQGLGSLFDPDVALPMAAALMGNGGNMANFGNAFAAAGPALKRNKTVDMLRAKDPDLADLIDAGLEPKDALSLFYEKQKLTAQGPKAPDIETFYDESTGQPYKAGWNAKTAAWDRIGGTKGDEGFEVTTADGTVVRQGSFGNQDRKNAANRISEEQDATKAAATLKQTVGVLRSANQNTGYSGPGAGVYGAVDDTMEQFGGGELLPGTAGARATMRSGALDAALANVQKTKGAISNAEMDLFMAAAPGISQTPQGNAAILDMLDAVADRQMMRAESMETWRRDHGSLEGFETAWGEYVAGNPLLAEDGTGGVTLASNRQVGAQGNGAPINTTSTGAKWRVK